MHEHAIQTARTARYATLGPDGGPVEEIWLACHGYGQLARPFLRPFGVLAAPGRLLVAPEALHRFYLDDAHVRAGASWMTREARQDDIADYVAYLDAVFSTVCARAAVDSRAVGLVAFGFSQGTATVSRWLDRSPLLASRPRRADRLVLWGGGLPHDLDLAAASWPAHVHLTLVVGEHDPYTPPEQVAAQETALHAAHVPFRTVRYDGSHRLNGDVLRGLAQTSDG